MEYIVKVIIPAYNEEHGIAKVLKEIPQNIVDEVIVVNNASTDNTAKTAERHGATVLEEPIKGYGRACLKGIDYIKNRTIKPDIVVFVDADHSDYPEEMPILLKPIFAHQADLVIGSRALGKRESASMTLQQIFGNWLATKLIKIFYGVKFTDLGPFRAIKYDALMNLEMNDKNYGWTVEMQVKAAKQGLSCQEVAVNYRKRIGVSKVSGTIKGTIMAGYKILWTIFKYML